MTDAECKVFLQWALPRLGRRWAGFRPSRRLGSGFDGEDAEPLATSDAKCVEVTQVQGQDLSGPVPFGKHDDRGIGKPDLKIAVAAHDFSGAVNIIGRETLQPIRAPRHLSQQRRLRVRADMPHQEVVQFGQNKG